MMYDLGRMGRQHNTIKNERHVGAYSPMRNCAGPRKRQRSIMQFHAGSDACIWCEPRGEQLYALVLSADLNIKKCKV